MVGKLLVFLGICLAIAESQNFDSNMGQNYNTNNMNNNNNNNRGYGMNDNNNQNSQSYNNRGSGSNMNYNGNSNQNSNQNQNYNNNNNMNNNNNRNGMNNMYCKPLEKKSRSLNINCTTLNGDVASCFEKIAQGTRAKLSCKKNYVVQDETMIPEMTCQNGAWNRELRAFKCLSAPIAVGYNYSVGQGFYKFYKSGRKWDEAKKICENDGGHLIVIDSPEERDAANSSMVGLPSKIRLAGSSKSGNKTKGAKTSSGSTTISASDDLLTAWIGYSDVNTDGVMMSVTNETMTQGWCDAAKSEKALAAKKKTSKYCIAMRPGSLCYTEVLCSYKRSFICEIEPAKSNETESSSTSTGTKLA